MNEHFTKVAVVQATPALFDSSRTIDIVKQQANEASDSGAKLVLFPEAFISGYPRGLSFGTIVGSRSDEGRVQWQRYWESAIEVPGSVCDQLGTIAKEACIYLVIGVTERERGSLYCTMLYFGPDGSLLHRHRKLKPTGAERIIWGEGQGDDLQVIATPFGKIGGLICWENYMPLARMALYLQGIELYLAPTADARESWIATLQHIACEGRCYVLGCNQLVKKTDYPAYLLDAVNTFPDTLCRGGSVIISPYGKMLAGPLWDDTGILYAELDPAEPIKGKLDLDVAGHYNRPDVFQFLYKGMGI